MSLPPPVRSLLVLALAAWMTFCCCEKRILAHGLELDAAAATGEAGAVVPSCCAGHCCGGDADSTDAEDGSTDGDSEDGHGRPGRCSDGCCTKSAAAAPPFSLDLDLVGAPLPPSVAAIEPALDLVGRMVAFDDLSPGEPPPRLALVISRRLRI